MNEVRIKARELDLILLENSQEHEREEKLKRLCEFWEECIQKLGSYCQLMKKLKDEISKFTYYTRTISTTYTEEIPYVILIDKMKEENEMKKNELKEIIKVKESEIEDLRVKLKVMDEKWNKVDEVKSSLYNDINRLKINNKQFESKLSDCENQIVDKEKTFISDLVQKQQLLSNSKELLKHNSEQLSSLSKFKTSYDNIDDQIGRILDESLSDRMSNELKGNTFVTNRKNLCVSQLISYKKIEEQLNVILNMTMKEYEDNCEKVKETLNEVEKKKGKLMELKRIFDNKIKYISYELKHMASCRESLERHIVQKDNIEKFQILEGNMRRRRMEKKSRKFDFHPSDRPVRNVMDGLENAYLPLESDVIDESEINEESLNHYSFTLFVSESLEEEKDASPKTFWKHSKFNNFCKTCYVDTFLCPHKLLEKEFILKFDKPIYQLKFLRPQINIDYDTLTNCTNRNLSSYYNDHMNFGTFDLYDANVNNGNFHVNEMRNVKMQINYPSSFNFDTPSLQLWNNIDIDRLTDDLKKRFDIEDNIPFLPRPIDKMELVLYWHEFSSYLYRLEVKDLDKLFSKKILNHFIDYCEKKYGYSILERSILHLLQSTSLEECNFYYFHLILSLIHNETSYNRFKYIVCVSECLHHINWSEVDNEKILEILQIFFPFLSNDDIDLLSLEYVSISKNQINFITFFNFIGRLIESQREPFLMRIEEELEFDEQSKKYEDFCTKLSSDVLSSKFSNYSITNSNYSFINNDTNWEETENIVEITATYLLQCRFDVIYERLKELSIFSELFDRAQLVPPSQTYLNSDNNL
ncbi:hypothetical protein SNEBB_000171 [Seison nebaliae]|nr:hypothetical protein SNEBB_000171 [Seison nebaliae]